MKSNKEELNNSLKEANLTLGELLKTKVRKKYVSIYMRPKAPCSKKKKVGLGTSAPKLWLDFGTAFVSLMRIQSMEETLLLLNYIRKILLCMPRLRSPRIGLCDTKHNSLLSILNVATGL